MARPILKPADVVGWGRDDRELIVIADLGDWVVVVIPPLTDSDGSPRTVAAIEQTELTSRA